MNPKVDLYLAEGCGRCALVGTPECKVHSWTAELKELRKLLLDSELTEDRKWGSPCYTFDNHNVVLISAFKDFCALNFFKGVLLRDPKKLLQSPGENSQSARYLRFTSLSQIKKHKEDIQDFIEQATELQRSGAKVDMKAKDELVFPEELAQKFEELPALKSAFLSLTPGRQRGYIIFFNGAKQSKTRTARIEKCIPQIMEGRGMHD